MSRSFNKMMAFWFLLVLIIHYSGFAQTPPPPTPLRPLTNAEVYSQTPTFEWQPVSGQTDFRVVVYNNAAGTNPYIVVNHPEQSSANSLTLSIAEALPAGQYWWEVNVAANGQVSNYSNLVTFCIKSPTPTYPVNTTVTMPNPIFQWQYVPNQTYCIVAYSDPSGTNIVRVMNLYGIGV